MLSSKSSRWSAGAGALCVVLLVATWFLLISPRRSDAADLHDQAANRLQMNDQLRRDIEALRAQNADLPRQQAILAAIKLEMPEEQAQAALVRKFDALAVDTGVDVTSYSQAAAVLATPAAAPGTMATPAPAGAPVAPSSGPSVYRIPTTLTFSGDYFSAARFVKKLQTELTRAFLVTTVGVESSDSGPDGTVTVTLGGDLFVLRNAGAAAVASSVTPAPSPTSTPMPSPSASLSPSATPTASPTATPTTTP